MAYYELGRLGDTEFEHLMQALLKKYISPDTITFGAGQDGAREAVFAGRARSYPTEHDPWIGDWVFQAKFHNMDILGVDKGRRAVMQELEQELDKVINKYHHKCDHFILATNVPFTGTFEKGMTDRIKTEIAPKFPSVQNIRVWHYDEMCRFIDNSSDIRAAFLHLVSPGDLIYEVLNARRAEDTSHSTLARKILLFIGNRHSKEGSIGLDQLGRKEEGSIRLKEVFIDLHVRLSKWAASTSVDPFLLPGLFSESSPDGRRASAIKVLLSGALPNIVLIGGPGQGKSTLCQLICQVNRAILLGQTAEFEHLGPDSVPIVARIPFRVVLREYAQWISDCRKNGATVAIAAYLAEQIAKEIGSEFSSDMLSLIASRNPILLFLDGLDEVTDPDLRTAVLSESQAFVDSVRLAVQADIQVVGSSRPGGHPELFGADNYAFIQVESLDREQTREYARRWFHVRGVQEPKRTYLLTDLDTKYAGVEPYNSILTTPLQVAIFLTIIAAGGEAPRQREGLFAEYIETIYTREMGKNTPALTMVKTEKQALLNLHDYIGYLLHRDSQGMREPISLMPMQVLRHAISQFFRLTRPWRSMEEVNQWVDSFIADARDRLVMLVEPTDGLFGFELRTFQEYFAAAHLSNAKDTKQLCDRFRAIATDYHWRQVVLFLAGRVARLRSNEARNLIDVLVALDRRQDLRWMALGGQLAIDLIRERVFSGDKRLQYALYECMIPGVIVRFPELPYFGWTPDEDYIFYIEPILERLAESQHPLELLPIVVFFSYYVNVNKLGSILVDRALKAGVRSLSILEDLIHFGISTESIINSVGAELSAPSISNVQLHGRLLGRFSNIFPVMIAAGWSESQMTDWLMDAITPLLGRIESASLETYFDSVPEPLRTRFLKGIGALESGSITTDPLYGRLAFAYTESRHAASALADFRNRGPLQRLARPRIASPKRSQIISFILRPLGMSDQPNLRGTDGYESLYVLLADEFMLPSHVASLRKWDTELDLSSLTALFEQISNAEPNADLWRIERALSRVCSFRWSTNVRLQRLVPYMERVLEAVNSRMFPSDEISRTNLRLLRRLLPIPGTESVRRMAYAYLASGVFAESTVPASRGFGLDTGDFIELIWTDYTSDTAEQPSHVLIAVEAAAKLRAWEFEEPAPRTKFDWGRLREATTKLDGLPKQGALCLLSLNDKLEWDYVSRVLVDSIRDRHALGEGWRLFARSGAKRAPSDKLNQTLMAPMGITPSAKMEIRTVLRRRPVVMPSINDVEAELDLPLSS